MTTREQAERLLDKLICNYRTHVTGVTDDPVAVEFIEAALRERDETLVLELEAMTQSRDEWRASCAQLKDGQRLIRREERRATWESVLEKVRSSWIGKNPNAVDYCNGWNQAIRHLIDEYDALAAKAREQQE